MQEVKFYLKLAACLPFFKLKLVLEFNFLKADFFVVIREEDRRPRSTS